ncbi:hypothetical protein [Streptomyces sp. H27-C3]|uniref:hypothetical protein n=1 Tax=Streptomyces sp. H27-C3 TaxID=3046305 RepID=UPI0024BA7F0B|nr:hypothetical protein [Streptomyces sp. H27-C3]MDJ0460961.1 hypothetical protein [Streptomyces sp. H27-C3]
MRRTGTTRRRALGWTGAAAAGLLTSACAEDSGPRGREGSAPDARSAAESALAEGALRRKTARTRRELLAHYDAVIAAHPTAADRLKPLREAVAEQADALRGPAAGPSPSAPASSSPSPTPSAAMPASPSAPPVAPDRRAALKELAAAERRSADTHGVALVDAPPELARLLASVAAAGAAHAYLLAEGDPK